ncbi:MAG: hypothetical protein M1829_005841 [Trizodia sp. TS-e1964]|nr:MAG: hypothetical protein M1829_005841 [Trizodia sp. TS-e1964]
MSPRRRSSRAQPLPNASASQHTHSSSGSSTSSMRADRAARSAPLKTTSPLKISRSASPTEDGEAAAGHTNSEPPQTRRRKRVREDDEADRRPDSARPKIDEEDDGTDEDDDEETRCVCGQQDYPGPPAIIKEASPPELDPSTKQAESDDPKHSDAALEAPAEADGALFIQCDVCKVWQHGGCVGIMSTALSPDEYFCEQCRKDLHRIFPAANGQQRYSRYLPVFDGLVNLSRASKDRDTKPPKDRAARQTSLSHSTKRRSTMNSRDAAYDEEEQFRRAIEESKGERKSGSIESRSRRGKRSRSDSEESKQQSKRLRTNSESPSPARPAYQSLTPHPELGEKASLVAPEPSTRRVRGAAARNHREKELRDKEKEKERADAAGRRNGRAERRRGEESDPSDEYAVSNKSTTAADQGNPPIEAIEVPLETPDTPTPPAVPPAPSNTSHRKTGRPPARKGRVGRNQYSKDREGYHEFNGIGSPGRSRSRDRRDDTPYGPTGNVNPHQNLNSEAGKPSKPRYMNPHRTTMNDMKRRVANILDFISRTQLELAGEKTPPAAIEGAASALMRGIADGLPMITVNDGGEKSLAGEITEKEFSQLTSLEMMDVLTRKLVLWQKDFGKWGEK